MDLAGVGFRLCKVRPRGQHSVELRREAVANVAARLTLQVTAPRDRVVDPLRETVRNDRQADALPQPADAGERTGARQVVELGIECRALPAEEEEIAGNVALD